MLSSPPISLNTDELNPEPKKQIKLLTYNAFLRPPLVHNNQDDFKNERCNHIIQQFKNFDIICFQEVFGFFNMRKSKIKHKAFKQGMTYQAVSPSPSFFSTQMVDGGLLTLSRYPILLHQFKEFPYGILSDNLSMKGILYTKIDVNGRILHLYNTHLQASYVGHETKIRATMKTRIDQMQCFRKFLLKTLREQNYTQTDLVLMVGDFNVDSRAGAFDKKVLEDFPHLDELMNFPQSYIEYDSLTTILSNQQHDQLIDQILKFKNEHLFTYADFETLENGDQKPLETCLTCLEDQCSGQCLDYIFQFVPQGIQSENSELLSVINAQVETFPIENQSFTQLSDHYGVSQAQTNIKDGFLLICNEILNSPLFPECMELYNRVMNIIKIQKEGLIINGIQIELDMIDHINVHIHCYQCTKIQLDKFISQQLESDAIIQGHRKISSALASLKKMNCEKQEQTLSNPALIMQTPVLDQVKGRNRIYQPKENMEQLDNQLEDEILQISERMKGIAKNIQTRLQTDNAILKKIESKQLHNQNNLEQQSSKLKKFMSSKSLSCSTIFLMLIISVILFVFAIVFIKLF